MTLETFCVALLFLAFAVCCFRARWVALAIAPPVLLILVRLSGLVDISSASHPLRVVVPVLECVLGIWAARCALAAMSTYHTRTKRACLALRLPVPRFPAGPVGARPALIASILVIGSTGPDLLALHPFFWERAQTWPLVPVMIVVLLSILMVLLAPERWVVRWTMS